MHQIVIELNVELRIDKGSLVEDYLVGYGYVPGLVDHSNDEGQSDHEGIEDGGHQNEGIVQLSLDDRKLVVFVNLGASPNLVHKLKLMVVALIAEVKKYTVVLIVEREVVESQDSPRIGPIEAEIKVLIVCVVQVSVEDSWSCGVLNEEDFGALLEDVLGGTDLVPEFLLEILISYLEVGKEVGNVQEVPFVGVDNGSVVEVLESLTELELKELDVLEVVVVLSSEGVELIVEVEDLGQGGGDL